MLRVKRIWRRVQGNKLFVLYGFALAVLVAALKYLEYKLFLKTISYEFYVVLIAIGFTILGLWLGNTFLIKPVKSSNDFVPNTKAYESLGITSREKEVLELIASGMSNKEIAESLFVSPNTVKTHTSNLLSKLDVTSRSKAVQRARTLSLIQ